MSTSRRHFLGIAATGIGLPGCLGGSGGPSGTTTPDSDVTVRVRSTDGFGEILVGPEGMTLYLFEQDNRGTGTSSCTGDCADAWPPLTVEETPSTAEAVDADVTTFDRSDGPSQVVANGWPLYYFQSDQTVGDVKGQGLNEVWWVLGPDGTAIKEQRTKSDAGPY